MAFSMQVVTIEPQISSGLLAFGLDMAAVLTVVALRKASLSSVLNYLDNYMVKAIQFEYLFRFYVVC
jgi:hypothetical protein